MNNDFIHTYNPTNAANLTSEEIEAMQTLTNEQLKQLAEHYPNHGVTNAYLILKDTSAKNQIYPVSTWVNLYNLRVKNGMKKYVAFTFKSLFVKRNVTNIPVQSKVQDLTQQEIEQAEGIRRNKQYDDINKSIREVESAFNEFEKVKKQVNPGNRYRIGSDENGELPQDPGSDPEEFPEIEVPKKKKMGRPKKNITNNKT